MAVWTVVARRSRQLFGEVSLLINFRPTPGGEVADEPTFRLDVERISNLVEIQMPIRDR
jgi:hypothetical protein